MVMQHHSISRRTIIRSAVAASGLLATVRLPLTAQAQEEITLPDRAIILFQGDSITDAGRSRTDPAANSAAAMGSGYAFMAASSLLGAHPSRQLRCFNRGISGNRVPDLAARWTRDTLELKPDVLSILIGVNDIWHKLHGNTSGTVADYEQQYRALLEQTHDALPKTRLVVCEPFALRVGAVNDSWYPEFDQRRAVAKRLAEEIKAAFVPFQSMFDRACEWAEPAHWAADGVHPTMAGHALMAHTWLETVKL
jgi:lysophospholipase L1-like esterase